MGCLWLTLADPEPPVNGQFLYSGGLIRSVANAGVQLTVLGLCQTGGSAHDRTERGIDWQITGDARRSMLARLCSPLPPIALRSRVPAMRAAVAARLEEGSWEAIVFDSIAGAWALPAALRHRRQYGTKLVYLSHNHEATAARSLATSSRGWRRPVRSVDALKVARLEHELAATADLVTANTPEDCGKFAAALPGKPVVFLPPGYSGWTVAERTFDGCLPRRAVVVGSFDWPVKRSSLESFLSVAAPLFKEAGVELQIVGGAEASYLEGLRRRFPGIEFTGRVADVRPYMAAARLALVPDQLGGFKLKTLDYVFNRLPIFAMEGAVPGTPLVDGQSIRLFASHEALAQGVVAAIDDLPVLDAQQGLAFTACADSFDWNTIGLKFVDAMRNNARSSERNAASWSAVGVRASSAAPSAS